MTCMLQAGNKTGEVLVNQTILLWVAHSGLPHNILRIFALALTKNMRRLHSTYVLSVVKDWVHALHFEYKN